MKDSPCSSCDVGYGGSGPDTRDCHDECKKFLAWQKEQAQEIEAYGSELECVKLQLAMAVSALRRIATPYYVGNRLMKKSRGQLDARSALREMGVSLQAGEESLSVVELVQKVTGAVSAISADTPFAELPQGLEGICRLLTQLRERLEPRRITRLYCGQNCMVVLDLCAQLAHLGELMRSACTS